MSNPYDQFLTAIRAIGNLNSIASLLDWDSETYMPESGLSIRAEQLALLSTESHERMTSDAMGAWLGALSDDDSDPVRRTNIRETRRLYDRAVKLPTSWVEAFSRATTLAKDAWGKARAQSDFAQFAPHLERLLELKRQEADLIGFPQERYDALLDEYEPGMTTAAVATIFEQIRGPLSDFVLQVADAPRTPDATILSRHYPEAAQRTFCRRLAEAIGFDFGSGRIDVSKHPFCQGTGPGDVRLTTRYLEDFFPSAVFGTLHEAGHGLYEQGLDAAHLFTPMGGAVSLGIHESQSRTWENLVGRSRPFWDCYYGECQALFPDALGDASLDAFFGAINTVRPSLIRVEADEVTYNLHIILRFELERAMISGRLAVKDVPDAWNTKFRELFGMTPPDDRDGCLQDIHWSMGAFGYFPTYALGNLYASQFFEAARAAMPDLDAQFRLGNFAPLLGWLRENIHRHGMRDRATELVQRVTGRPLSPEPFLAYVRAKFAPIYGI